MKISYILLLVIILTILQITKAQSQYPQNFQKALKKAQQNKSQRKQKMNRLKQSISDKQNEIEQLKRRLAEKKEDRQCDEQIKRIQDHHIQELQTKISAVQLQIKQILSQIKLVQDRQKDFKDVIRKIKQENEALTAKNIATDKTVKDLRELVKKTYDAVKFE